ncbi:MAG: acetate uptake transporter [Spirochaetales bacterium]|nr:acetate uptake transporter [Spirochaetales bacterium]
MNDTADRTVSVSDSTADPAPLGLLGFGPTTILLNVHNAGLFPPDSMIMGMDVFVGGSAQIVFGSLAALFFLLAIRDFACSAVLGVIAGSVGIACGASAFSTSIAHIPNETCDRTVLPPG